MPDVFTASTANIIGTGHTKDDESHYWDTKKLTQAHKYALPLSLSLSSLPISHYSNNTVLAC
jgi:hypothetical protein